MYKLRNNYNLKITQARMFVILKENYTLSRST